MDGVRRKQPTTMTSTRPESTASLETLNALVRQYGCGPVRLTGTSDALYERHLFFDNVADPATVGARERYEALARSIRDVLSQRWVLTEQTYERENPKRVYYLSMEFLIGRSLANNITNLLVSPFISEATKLSTREWLGLLEAEPDAGLGNGGLGRLAACFLDSMATMQLPAMGYGLRYEYGMFRQSLERRLAARAAGQLAPSLRPMGGRAAGREGRGQPELLVRDPSRSAATHFRSAVHADWRSVRSAGGGVRRQDDQHASALGGGSTRLLRFPGVQSRPVRRRAWPRRSRPSR